MNLRTRGVDASGQPIHADNRRSLTRPNSFCSERQAANEIESHNYSKLLCLLIAIAVAIDVPCRPIDITISITK